MICFAEINVSKIIILMTRDMQVAMKYQEFSSDENFVSSEDTIFILHMRRYHGCHGNFSLSQ